MSVNTIAIRSIITNDGMIIPKIAAIAPAQPKTL